MNKEEFLKAVEPIFKEFNEGGENGNHALIAFKEKNCDELGLMLSGSTKDIELTIVELIVNCKLNITRIAATAIHLMATQVADSIPPITGQPAEA